MDSSPVKEKLKIYTIEVAHKRLGLKRSIRGSNKLILKVKAQRQLAEWKKKLQAIESEKQKQQNNRLPSKQSDLNVRSAEAMTMACQDTLNTLAKVWDNKDAHEVVIKWRSLLGEKPQKPSTRPLIPKPDKTDDKYQPRLGILDKLNSSKREYKEALADQVYKTDVTGWAKQMKKINNKNNQAKGGFDEDLKEWESVKNSLVKAKSLYMKKVPGAILDYCDMVLSQSKLPDVFSKVWFLDYDAEEGVLIIDYLLPRVSEIPKVQSVEFDAASNQFIDSEISESQLKKLYDKLMCQLALRSIYEQFTADKSKAISKVVFNGYIEKVDKTSKQKVVRYLMSIKVNESDFSYIRHSDVSVSECFKNLGGVGDKLFAAMAIKPLRKAR